MTKTRYIVGIKRITAFLLTFTLAFAYAPTFPVVEANAEDSFVGGLREVTGIEVPAFDYTYAMKKQELNDSLDTEYKAGEASATVKIRDWSMYSSDYYYEHMNADEQKLFDGLDESCRFFMENADIDAVHLQGNGYNGYYLSPADYDNLTTAEVKNIVMIFGYAHPEYYFNGTSYLVSTDKKVYLCCFDAFYKGSTRAAATNAFFNKIDNMIASITSGSKNYLDVEKAAHDLLCNNITYQSNDYDQSIYSAVMLNQSVCAGYSLAMELLMNAVGIPSIVMTSSSHAWNKVNLGNGQWYCVDVTWDDRTTYISYELFNKSDTDIKVRDKQGEHVPNDMCSSYAPSSPYSLSFFDEKEINSTVTTRVPTTAATPTTVASTANVIVTTTTAETTSVATTTAATATTTAASATTSTAAATTAASATSTAATATTENASSSATATTTEAATTENLTPAKPKIKSLKASKGKLKISFKKLTTGEFYTIKIATNKSFTKNVKNIAVLPGYSSLTIKGLKKKRYYVKIRRVRYANARNYNSKWSAIKSAKVK